MENEQNRLTETDEISLRELIEAILNGKVLIAVITVAAILISTIVSFFFLPKTYEAKSVLLTNPISISTVNLETADSAIVDYLTSLPEITIATYLEQILSPEVLDDVIRKLDMKNDNGDYISANSLAGSISVANIDDTNLISIQVTENDPQLAADIANTLGQSFIEFVTRYTQAQSRQSLDLISNQLDLEEQNLNQAAAALAAYWQDNQNIDVLKGQVANLVSQTISYEATLQSLQTQIDADAAALKTLLAASGTSGSINPDDFSVVIDPDSTAYGQLEIQLGSNNLSQALLTVEISRIQTRLVENASQMASIENALSDLEIQLTATQTLLTEEEYKYNALNRDYEIAKQAYDAYQEKYKEAALTAASDLGKISIIVSSEAAVPTVATGPNKVMNLAIALVLGLMLGIFVVLFRDYWRKSKVQEAV